MRTVAIASLFCLLGYLGSGLSGIERLEFAARDARMAQVSTSASGAYVLVAVDAQSLETVGNWPWSRQVHADLVGLLTQAGAAEIFFDVDFGFPSDANGDLAFAEALANAGNVSLPRFVQTERFGSEDLVRNEPLPAFAEASWPVSVNVTTDRFGRVRDYPMGAMGTDGFVPSVAAFLTGRYAESTSFFSINYTIGPGTVPAFSASDVLAGEFPPDAFADRAVIVGATAIQLGDYFNVPVHGVIPGALVHALAAETLDQDIALQDVRIEFVLLGLFSVLVLLQHRWLDPPARTIAALLAIVAATEATAFAALEASIVVPTVSAYGALGLFCLGQFATRLGLRDLIIDRKEAEIKDTRGLLDQVFFDSFDALLIVDDTGVITQKSRSAFDLLRQDLTTLEDLPPSIRSGVKRALTDRGQSDQQLQSSTIQIEGGDKHIEYTITPSEISETRDGVFLTKRIATVSIRDTTLLREKEREIAYLSTYDPLTGALRRNSFLDFLNLRLSEGTGFALFAVNLSRFKSINLLMGREIGDAVLAEMVSRLENPQLRLSAPARLDGDTFAVFSEVALDASKAHDLALQLVSVIEQPVRIGSTLAQVGAHIGYAVIDALDRRDAVDCLAKAEAALDAARDDHTSAPQVFSPSWSEKQTRARAIEGAMEQALEREEFFLTYQPQHRVADGALIGSEALVRWNSEEFGPVLPDEFIEIAESNGFIVDLGRWVLRTALVETLKLSGDLDVAVNVSGAQMAGNSLIDDVVECLADTGFPPHRLCLEMTESVLMSGHGDAAETMRDIGLLGPSWALDDFGTGYSSLAYLANFPLEKVKLDRSFMIGLGDRPAAEMIVRAVRSLSAGLGMKLLCEGVETKQHLKILRRAGCDEVQGYYFGEPMSFDRYRDYVNVADPLQGTG